MEKSINDIRRDQLKAMIDSVGIDKFLEFLQDIFYSYADKAESETWKHIAEKIRNIRKWDF